MEWKRGPILGRGSSASVSLATTATGDLFAVKSADVSSSSFLQKEQFLISQLCSPFIVKCFGSDITYDKDKSVYNLFLEYIPGGTLSDLIRKQGGSLGEDAIRFYARQMLEGLSYLHLKGVVHCDIKGQNVLIGGDELIKIADFGCAKWAERGGSVTQTFAGTPAYMAPEVARGEDQGFPADIWALGCTVVEMATGSNPWPEMKDPASALYRVGFSADVPEVPNWFSDAARDFVGKCLMRDSGERWTAAELLLHPFLNSGEANSGKNGEFITRESPTSVMNRGFWDAVEVAESSPTPTEIPLAMDSAAGRIRDLIGEGFSRSSYFPEWREEEDWVMVRGDEIEESSTIHQQNQDCVTFSSVDEEGTPSSIAIEDSIFSDEISVINISSLQDDSVSEAVALQRMVMEIFCDLAPLFLLLLLVVLCFFPANIIPLSFFNFTRKSFSNFSKGVYICSKVFYPAVGVFFFTANTISFSQKNKQKSVIHLQG